MFKTFIKPVQLTSTNSTLLIAKIEENCLLGDKARILIIEEDIQRNKSGKANLALYTPRDLGFADPPEFREIFSKFWPENWNKQNTKLDSSIQFCSLEITCQFRIQYVNQPISQNIWVPVFSDEEVFLFCLGRYYCGFKILYAYTAESFVEKIGLDCPIIFQVR